MDRSTFSLILISVLLASIAQILLKAGMSGLAGAGATPPSVLLWEVATNLKVVSGLLLYGLSAAVWLVVLSRVPVGLAYPFVSLGFVMTLLLAWLLRGEVPSAPQILGTLTICLGVALMARA